MSEHRECECTREIDRCGEHREHDREQEELQFPRTNIYHCFNPCTCDNDCMLCRARSSL